MPRQSLSRKLPLLISALLVAVIVVFTFVSYREIANALLNAAVARMTSTAQLLDGVFEDSGRHIITDARRAANDSTLRRYVVTRDSASRDAALVTLGRSAAVAQTIGVEIQDRAGKQLLWVDGPSASIVSSIGQGRPDSTVVSRQTAISNFAFEHNALYYNVAVPIHSSSSAVDTAAFLVQYRELPAGQGTLIRGLIASDASMLVGSQKGGSWTDLSTMVPGPLPDAKGRYPNRYTSPDGVEWIGGSVPVKLTPWLVWVGVPVSAALEPAHEFLGEVVLAAILLVLIGGLGALALSRHIIKPLREVTVAAQGIAAGDYSHRVQAAGNDELGILAASFNSMAAQVEESRQDMEGRVAQRTLELEHALGELHQTQETLVRREKLAILGQLAGGVGHELRNPLGVMTNAIYYLSVVLKDAPENVKEYLGILRTQVGLSEKIVGDLLDFARVKQPNRESVSVAAIVDVELERVGPKDGVAVERDFPVDLPLLCVDRVQIGQVVLNLISNALQAMDGSAGQRTLTLRARADTNGAVTLEVSDTGVGMTPEQIAKIFDPLYTTKARGIGLGLSVSRTLAHSNGAEILATSELGVGSTVMIAFRATEAAAA